MTNPKQLLREQLRKEYALMDDDYKNNSDIKIISHIRNFVLYKKCSKIFIYASTANEIYTHDFIQEAYAAGKTVLLPKCCSKGIMDFYEYKGHFSEGRYGICEPTGTECCNPETNDLMIVPGLSFTKDGMRLGQGGGYYDRFLEKYPCVTVGLCREQFIKQELPREWNDLPVDYVITETGIFECKNGAS